MSLKILGISAFYHDSAAAIVEDGAIIAAAQEERFTRVKHDPRFPKHAINYCLEELFIEADELDAVVFYDNPLLTYDRVLKTQMMTLPKGEENFTQATESILGVKAHIKEFILDFLKVEVPVYFTTHHTSHAASAFFPSPFDQAAILTLDGVGEWNTTTIGKGDGNRIEMLKKIDFPHSLGLLYSAFTYFTGFKVNSGEYKLMGLAPYGEPIYADKIKEHLIDIKDDGSFRLNMEYFGYLDSNLMISQKFEKLFDGPAREGESRITKREMDLAASIQVVTEEVVLKIARTARELTGMKNLVLAGGVALNCVANGKLLKEKIFEDIWIQPASGDAGGALGAALLATHHTFNLPRTLCSGDAQKGSYLGPQFSSAEITAVLDKFNYPYEKVEDQDARFEQIASALAEGKVVGFFSGRMEYGPRALGGRSILGDARNPETQVNMNLKIKYRESFRPFAPSVLEEDVSEYFDINDKSPYMLLVAPVEGKRLKDQDKFEGEDLLEWVRKERSDIPAITHVDNSARIQTVSAQTNRPYYELIRKFKQKTGIAVIVNTSFNVRGEPIVCTPQDAYKCFMRTEMDFLVLEDCILDKSKQPKLEGDSDWRNEYELD